MIAALASALLLVGAAPPFNLWPLALVALVPLYLATRAASFARAVALAWLCGFAVNLCGQLWGVALLERLAGVSRPVGALFVVAIAAYQACVFALWIAGAHFAHRRLKYSWLLVAPLCVVLAESLVPMIFPWYLAIGVWRAWPLVQIAELGGPSAVSALLVLCNMIVAELVRARVARRPLPSEARIGALVALALVAFGLLRAGQIAWLRQRASALRVGLVQPNFGVLTAEARRRRGEDYLAVLRRATDELGDRGARLVVWPESSFPFVVDRRLAREYAPGHPWRLRDRYDGRLLLGALTHDFGRADEEAFNSALLVGAGGELRGLSDKTRLVAFGEYVPFAGAFPRWADRVRARLPDSPALEPGRFPSVLDDGELRVGPLICYEDTLPELVAELARARPNLLVTLADHAWFGASAAPEQALALATLRSVESRRDLVRAANTGASALVDALGRVVARSRLTDGAAPPELLLVDARLIDAFAFGPWTVRLFPFACAGALAAAALRRRRRFSP